MTDADRREQLENAVDEAAIAIIADRDLTETELRNLRDAAAKLMSGNEKTSGQRLGELYETVLDIAIMAAVTDEEIRTAVDAAIRRAELISLEEG